MKPQVMTEQQKKAYDYLVNLSRNDIYPAHTRDIAKDFRLLFMKIDIGTLELNHRIACLQELMTARTFILHAMASDINFKE